MTFEEFKSQIIARAKEYPLYIRKGQGIFNAVDELTGVARAVQFKDHIDCYHNDENIEAFLKASWKRVNDLLRQLKNLKKQN